jgi:tetratricopeptide (TPR) repeat protein
MWNLLRGRLLLARAKPAEALAALEEGLRLWPDNSVARWLAAQAAEQLGDYDRALTEYREAIRNDTGNREALVSLLRLLEAAGQDHEALAALARYHGRRERDAEMLVQTIRFARRAGQWRAANVALTRLGKLPGQRALALAELAAIQAQRRGPAAGVEVIRAAELDLTRRSNEPALRALVEQLIAGGNANEAVTAAQAALAAHPDVAGLHELRGRALRAGDDPSGAREALGRALELEPERASALAELAAIAAAQGDREAAIALYDRAARADPEEPAHAWNAILLVAASDAGAEDSERRAEALLARHGTHAGAAKLLARRLETRDPVRALALARRAVRFRGGPDALDTLGRIQLARGDAERAARTLTRAVELRPDSPSTRYWQGVALAAAGDADAARHALREALVAETFPEREAAQAELARLGAD